MRAGTTDGAFLIGAVEIPSTGADHKLFVKKAERGLANQARKLVREIPARAVEELTEGKKTLEVIAFDRDQGFRHRQDYRFWKHGDFVDPGVEVLRRALEQDPFFGKVLEGIAKLGMTATLEDGAIMVKI
jgi:hypothetical protein